MYRFLFCTVCFFSIFLPLSAGVKIIVPAEERSDIPQIEIDSSNLRTEPFAGDEKFQSLPEESFAAVLGMPEEHIRWAPAQDPVMIHKMRLTGDDISFDGSVLLLAETTGSREGPNGTRLLIFSTTNLILLRVIELPCLATEIHCEGSSGRIWFLRKPQPETLCDTPAVCILNAKSGKLEKEIPLKTLPKRLYPHITGKFAWILRENGVFRLFTDGTEQPFLKVKDAKDLKISLDRRYFAILTDSETKLYSTQAARMFGTYKYLPGNTFLFLSGEPPSLLIGKNVTAFQHLDWPESLFLCSGKSSSRLLTDNLSGPVAPDTSGNIFYAVKPKNRLEKINAGNGKILGFAHYRSIKPVVKGSLLKIFPLNEPHRFLILDSVGGISKIDTSSKRWKRIGSMRPWTE